MKVHEMPWTSQTSLGHADIYHGFFRSAEVRGKNVGSGAASSQAACVLVPGCVGLDAAGGLEALQTSG